MYDARFEAAKATDQSDERGWHFPPTEEREPTNAPIFLAVLAVMIVGLSAIASLSAVM